MLLLTHWIQLPLVGMTVRDIYRPFSTTSFLNQKEIEPKFLIMGSSLTVADVRDMKAESRTVAHWRLLVDWDLQVQRPYVIVDPFDPRGLLYLSRGEYLLQSRVCLNNDLTLMLVARSGDKPMAPISSDTKKSPTQEEPFSSTKYFSSRANRLAWKDFVRLRRFSVSNVKIKDGMVTVSPDSIERAVMVWTRQLFHYCGVTAPERRLSGLFNLTKALRVILSNNGAIHLVKRLKVALFAVYSYLSGNPLSTTEALGFRIRLSGGLPRLIPAQYRKLIRDGDLMWIRIWVSILNIYRSFNVKLPDPETAYKTIRTPMRGFYPNFDKFAYFARHVFPHLIKQLDTDGTLTSYSYSLDLGTIIRSAGANLKSSMSLFSIVLDAKAWFNAPINYVLKWFEFHGDETAIALMTAMSREEHFPTDFTIYDDMVDLYPAPPFKTPAEQEEWVLKRRNPLIRRVQEDGSLSGWLLDAWKLAGEVQSRVRPILGRIFNFAAPGGKLRTVAVCDYWTQIIMKPIHERLFVLLRILHRNDATFDQQGTVDRYWNEGHKPHWSFDLSAATDTIPILLYRHVLAPFFIEGDGDYDRAYSRATLWAKLLTDREFGIPSPRKGEIGHNPNKRRFATIRYEVGQPMGALSSWASMALVHHALVQYAHWCISESTPQESVWFDPYLVLGDDVDISRDARVSTNYQLACADFGIKIGLAKSLRSNSNFFEFANQRLCDTGNISPLSFLEEISSQTWNSRVEFASRIAARLGLRMKPHVLIRLVTSARQWLALVPEFSGARDRIFVRFLNFILLSPLNTYWHSEVEISIASIKNWLQLLNKSLLGPMLNAVEDYERVDLLICKSLANKIRTVCDSAILQEKAPISLMQLHQLVLGTRPPLMPLGTPLVPNAQMGNFPYMRGTYRIEGPGTMEIMDALARLNLSESHVHLIMQYFGLNDRQKAQVPSLAPVSYLYIFFCAFKHNEELLKQLTEIREQLMLLEARMKERDVPAQLFKLLVKGESPLADLVSLYWKATALPKAIKLDVCPDPHIFHINRLMFGIKPSVRPQDRACELLNLIIPVFAQWTGVAVTNLPVLPVGGAGMKPRTLKALTRWHSAAQVYAKQVRMSVKLTLGRW